MERRARRRNRLAIRGMKLYQIFLNIEIQSDYKVVYYNHIKEERVQVNPEDYTDRDVMYLYVDDGFLYIEIEFMEEIDK